MKSIQKVTVELKNGKFKLTDNAKVEELNPKALILCSAAQCAGFTIMGILAKDKITLNSFEITAWGELDTATLKAESVFQKFNISYNIHCHHIGDQNSVSEAVHLGHQQLCGVVNMLRKIAPVDHEISIVSTE
jgi:putative redox protein